MDKRMDYIMEKCVKKVKIQHNDKVWLGEV